MSRMVIIIIILKKYLSKFTARLKGFWTTNNIYIYRYTPYNAILHSRGSIKYTHSDISTTYKAHTPEKGQRNGVSVQKVRPPFVRSSFLMIACNTHFQSCCKFRSRKSSTQRQYMITRDCKNKYALECCSNNSCYSGFCVFYYCF